MKRPVIASCLSLALAGTSAPPVQAQSAFVSEVRSACATQVAAAHKYMVELQGFTVDEADNGQINPRMAALLETPRYALKSMSEQEESSPVTPLYVCAARFRLNQLVADQPPPLSSAELAAAQAAGRGRCMGSVAALKGFLPELTEAQYGPLIDKMVDQMTAMSAAERDLLLSKGGDEDPAEALSKCIGGVVIEARSGGGAQVAAARTPSAPEPASNPTGATPQQIADAEARNAQAREVGARQRAESDAFMRDAAIRAGKIYQSAGPDGGQIALHPTTGQRCVTAALGPKEPYGDDGVVHVIEFTNVCDKTFRIRARIIPLGPISDTSGGVQGTGIDGGSLSGPNKGRLICIQKPNRETGTCSGFTEWWVF